jgi:hypothetical protein
MTELEGVINRSIRSAPPSNGVLPPDLRALADLYGNMIFDRAPSVDIALQPERIRLVVLKWLPANPPARKMPFVRFQRAIPALSPARPVSSRHDAALALAALFGHRSGCDGQHRARRIRTIFMAGAAPFAGRFGHLSGCQAAPLPCIRTFFGLPGRAATVYSDIFRICISTTAIEDKP